jgi:hypothetical protein
MVGMRSSQRRSDQDLITVLAGLWAAAEAAARYSGGRLGNAGQLARRMAEESPGRMAVAYRAYRGELPVRQRRPGEYLAVGVCAGAAGAATALGILRMVSRRATGSRAEPESAAAPQPADTARTPNSPA